MAHADNISDKALEQVQSGASGFWTMFSQSVKGVLNIQGLQNEILGIWRESDYASRINQTLQDTKEAFEQFTVWSQQICDKKYLHDLTTGSQFVTATIILTALLLIATVASITTWMHTKQSKNKDARAHKRASTPPKVLSIFEMAKTAYVDGHSEEVMKLVEKLKFDVNFPVPTTGMSLFLCACISGEKQLVEFLLKKGGDTNAVNSDGDSCLYLATFASSNSANCSLIELLLKHGCKVNGQNNQGNTALHLAASRGSVEQVQTFLQHGVDPVRANNFGISPLDCAISAGHMGIVELLDVFTHV